jgi:hypothetical protein
METQEVFNNWVKVRVALHFAGDGYQNEYEEDSIEREVYDAEWKQLEELDNE